MGKLVQAGHQTISGDPDGTMLRKPHCRRDIVEGLNVASCTRQGDFEWQRQLRSYYHVEDDTMQIKQVSC